MTLTEFLLARIAEDEAALPHVTLRIDADGHYLADFHDRARAECEAKRQIVERCEELLSVDGWEYTDAPDAAEATLCDLAAIYADHPDYRDEWRP